MTFLLLKSLLKLAQTVIWTFTFFAHSGGMWQGSLGSPQLRWFCLKDSRFNIYLCSWLRFITAKGWKAKSPKSKGTWDKVWGKPGISFQESILSGVTWSMLNSTSNKMKTCEAGLPRKIIRDLAPRLIGDWSHKCSLYSMHQDSRLPERTQVFSINHSVHTG